MTRRTAEVYRTEYKGIPVEVAASWLASRGTYEVVIWLNPDHIGIRDGAPCEHRTLYVTPAQFDAWRADLVAPRPAQFAPATEAAA